MTFFAFFVEGSNMKNLLRLGYGAVLVLMGPTLFSAQPRCRVAAIVAKDTGNVIGYVVSLEGSSIVVQNANNIGVACQQLINSKKQPKNDAYEV